MLNPDISRAFAVPDAAIDSFKTCWANARDAESHGAQILPYHQVANLIIQQQHVKGASVLDIRTGKSKSIRADYVVNASGAWAGQIAAMAGIQLQVIAGKGIMIAMNHRLVQTVINRCKMPDDGDIIVPIRTVCVIGTTDVRAEDPDHYEIEEQEIDLLLNEGEKLIPGFRQSRALRVWAGVRPLYREQDAAQSAESRDLARTMALLDHSARDEIQNFITITGGKFTTYRLMAERTVDAVCRHLKVDRRCDTASSRLPDSEPGKYYWLPSRLSAREQADGEDQLICECEMISRSNLELAFERRHTNDLDDIRRSLRLGMGPCQGGFCIYRATGILHTRRDQSVESANNALKSFLQERWKGVKLLMWGDQLRQARFDDWIFQGLLDVEHLQSSQPSEGRRSSPE
jgi:glycerol-3-phosphate dehydrogenase